MTSFEGPDRGGINWPIHIDDKFSETLKRFERGIMDAAAGWEIFAEEARKAQTASRDAVKTLRNIVDVNNQAAEASKKSERSARRRVEALNAEEEAWRSIEKDIHKAEVAIRKQVIAAELGIDASERTAKATRKQARELSPLEKALKRVEARVERQKQLAEEERIITQQNIETLRFKAKAITAEETAIRRVRAAQQKLVEQEAFLTRSRQAGLADQERRVKLLSAEAEALKRLTAAEFNSKVESILRAQGRDARGRKLPEQRFVTDQGPLQGPQISKAELDKLQRAEELRRIQEQEFQRLREKGLRQQVRQSQTYRDQARELGIVEGSARKASRAHKDLDAAMKPVESRANRIAFTFRRLIGIFAAFAAVRTVVRGFQNLVRESINFQSSIEQANLGVASLVTAIAQIQGPQGRILQGAEAFAAAQTIAADQTRKLRQESLRTAATFDELAEAFQTAVAPGLQAGLNLDQIRQLSVRISQAATAIALPQNQLAEEIRSLLQGTIQARTTRIATFLGITNEDVRRAKEFGDLAGFLQARFEAFAISGEQALNTFAGLTARAKDAMLQLVGTGAERFFDELKTSLRAVFDLATDAPPDGLVVADPKAVQVVKGVTSALADAVKYAREAALSLDFSTALKFAEGLGAVLRDVASIVTDFVKGVIQGLSAVGDILNVVRGTLSSVLGLFGEGTGGALVAFFARLLTVSVALRTVWQTITGLWAVAGGAALIKMIRHLAQAVLLSSVLGGFWATILAPIYLITGAIAGIVYITRDWIDSLLSSIPIVRDIYKFLKNIASLVLTGVGTESSMTDTMQQTASAAIDLRKTIQELPAAISASTRALEGQANAVQRIRDEFVKAREAADLARVLEGVEGSAAKQIEALASFVSKMRDEAKELSQLQRAATNESIQLESRMEVVGIRRLAMGKEQATLLERAVALMKEQRDAISRRDSAYKKSLDAERRIALLRERGASFEERDDIAREFNDLQASAKVADRAVKEIEASLREIQGLVPAGALENFHAVAKEILSIQQDEIQNSHAIAELAKARQVLESQVASTIFERVRQAASEELRGLRATTQEAEHRLIAERLLMQVRRDASRSEDERVALARAELQIMRDEQGLAAQRRAGELAGLEISRQIVEDRLVALRVERESAGLTEERSRDLDQLISQGDQSLFALERQIEAIRRLFGLETDLAKVRRQAATDAIDRQNRQINVQVAAERRLVNVLEQVRAASDARDDIALRRLDAERTIVDIQNQIAALDLEKQSAEQITVARQRLNAELEIAKIKLRDVNAEAVRTVQSLQAAAVAAERMATAFETGDDRQVQLAQAQNQVDSLRQQLAVLNQIEGDEETRLLRAREISAQLRQQELALRRAQQALTGSVGEGAAEGARQFALQFSSRFEQGARIAEAGFQGLAQTAAATFVDALDPNRDASLGERWIQFAQGLGQMILNEVLGGILADTLLSALKPAGATEDQTTAAAAIAGASASLGTASAGLMEGSAGLSTAAVAWTPLVPGLISAAQQLNAAAIALGVALGVGGAAGGGATVARARGGRIPDRGRASVAHRFARGFHAGGRPAGIHPKDTVPAWLQPKEWVMQVAAVRKYGDQFMARLNAGAIPENLIHAISGAGHHHVRKPRTPSFATGGSVSGRLSALRSQQASASGVESPPFATLTADDGTLSRLLAGGRGAHLRAVESSRGEMRARLGVDRRR